MNNKNDKKGAAASGGIGFCGLLGIAFIVLKLVGVISWSWVWVLAPLWVPFVLATILVILMIIRFAK